jgi:hypothetical protein
MSVSRLRLYSAHLVVLQEGHAGPLGQAAPAGSDVDLQLPSSHPWRPRYCGDLSDPPPTNVLALKTLS